MGPETQLCVSLAARPGSFGNRFHNFLYGELGLDFAYRGGTTSDLPAAIAGLRGLRIRGCGLSMPYKEQVLGLLDEVEPVARGIGAVNTVVNEDVGGRGRLVGYNTDYVAVRELLRGRMAVAGMGTGARVALAGSGGMARACAYALRELGLARVTVVARNRETGGRLAAAYGFEWAAEEAGGHEILINATPVGMRPDPPERVPFKPEAVRGARLVVESVAYPPRTTLVGLALDAGAAVVDGFDITLRQAVEQFRLYTGRVPSPEQIARAAAVARG